MRAWLPWKGGGGKNNGNNNSSSSSSPQTETPQDAILLLQQQQQQQQRLGGERGVRASVNSAPVNIISRPWNNYSSTSSSQQQQQQQQQQLGRLTGSGGGGSSPALLGEGSGGVIQALSAHPSHTRPHHHHHRHHHHHHHHNSAKTDAEIERRVATSARNLGEGVSRIVLAARMGGNSSGGAVGGAGGEWKAQLLQLLGGSDEDSIVAKSKDRDKNIHSGAGAVVVSDDVNTDDSKEDDDGGDDNTPTTMPSPAPLCEPTDIDYLLEHSSTCERFVLRCVENELPPNLIHCLRLLRVLELQRDQQQHHHQTTQVKNNNTMAKKERSQSSKSFATSEVEEEEDEEEEEINDKELEEEIRDENSDNMAEKATPVVVSPPPPSSIIGPISQTAASKVSRLLCHLCSDSSVGEQLRPHLFGLLALSGASYPQCGVHIASAASDVIRAFSANCLSPSLVWFLNDRKMIVHMTDDIKELCAMAPISSSSSPAKASAIGGGVGSSTITSSSSPSSSSSSSSSRRSLYGSDAEIAGLWVIALRTIVYLVANSCNYQCVELLKDFDGAGGYHVLAYAIEHSSERHVPKLLELVTVLVCCKIATSSVNNNNNNARSYEGAGGEGMGDNNTMMMTMMDGYDDKTLNAIVDVADNKVAMNTNAFEIMDGLMMRSIPLLKAYGNQHEGGRPTFVGGRVKLTEMTDFSVKYAWEALLERNLNATKTEIISMSRDDVIGGKSSIDLTSELLVTTLQLYSDHAKNFDLIESEYHTLSHYLLSFPSFSDVSVKVLTLKTLEYVCTGVAGANSLMPLRVVTEIFISQCKLLLKVASEKNDKKDDDNDNATAVFETARQDLQMLCDTLMKLLEFDETVSHVMLECGLLGSKLDDVLNIIMTSLASSGEEGGGVDMSQDTKRVIPTPAVKTKIDSIYECLCRVLKLVARQPVARTASEDHRNSLPSKNASSGESCRLTSFLSVGILNLGDSAAIASLGVFDAIMAKNHNSLLGEDMACLLSLLDQLSLYPTGGNDEDCLHSNPKFIKRQTSILEIIKSILQVNVPSQDLFRTCGGFQYLVRLFFCIEGMNISPDRSEAGDMVTMELLESAFSLLATATDPNARNLKKLGDLGTPPIALDIITVDVDLSMASSELPSTTNLFYLRKNGFYVEFANAIAGTGILKDITNARRVVNLSLELVHPKLVLSADGRRVSSSVDAKISSDDTISIRNADATRLVLGLATRLPDTDEHKTLAKNAFDELLRLCANDMAGSALTRLASSGLCTSLTSRKEFATMLEDRSHFLYSRFVLLLRRIAAFSMTYNDFVSLLRCVAGPILLASQDDDNEYGTTPSQNNRIRLAVISSSIQNKKVSSAMKSESWQTREIGFCNRLETLSVIAERGDRVARCEVGGDSLNSIAMYMQNIPLEDRMYKLAEQGRLKFLEIEKVDASAQSAPIGVRSTDSSGVWSPLVSSGFTYSVWLRQQHSVKDGSQCSLFIFDISNPPVEKSSPDGSGTVFPYGSVRHEFFSCWYDVPNQRFCVLTSSNSRGEPTCFPVSPLPAGVWHHIQLTYHAPKRSMLGRKAVITLYIDGRPLESDAKIDAFNLPPNARIHIGVPNPVLASSGIVRGSLPLWDLGPTLLISSVLGLRDATAIYTAGPEFPGLFWGDRPQHWSLAAAATAAFVMLAENGEKGSVAAALRRRKVPSMEAVGHVMRERGLGGAHLGPESDSLSAVGLLCSIPPEQIIFGFRASSSSVRVGGRDSSVRQNISCHLINISRINTSGSTSTDAAAYGYSSIISPNCFADNVQWIGGPNILLPVVNAAQSSSSLALSLRLIRESVRRHPPNLEMLQSGGGYRMLALLLRQKRIMDANVLDQCFAFAVHGFVPSVQDKDSSKSKISKIDSPGGVLSKGTTHRWVFADLDAMKYLLLNHQVWDLSGAGPELPLRLLRYFNGLVIAHSTHAAFNSRRLHLLGIIRWALHLMLEATELFAEGASAAAILSKSEDSQDKVFLTYSDGIGKPSSTASTALKNGWFANPPLMASVTSGCDPGNDLLLNCKTLLRRVLTFMLTPGDLEAIAGAAVYTLSITGGSAQDMGQSFNQKGSQIGRKSADVLAPGSVTRVYLLRLLEELVVDGVNEIVTEDVRGAHDTDGPTESSVEPHLGGSSNLGQSHLGTTGATKQKKHDPMSSSEIAHHPKYQEAQIFLAAFAGILTPVWFACILEGCREEASASAVLRLLILMIQNSRKFAVAFDEAGGFAPLVLSIPRFSTCPSIIVPLLSHLLHAPILQLPCFSTLDPKQLCDAFDAESDADGLIAAAQESIRVHSDPSSGIFALLAECLGRNIQLASFDYDMGLTARSANEAVLHLLSHQHAFSPSFQSFCRTPDFLEPLAQVLCLAHDEKMQKLRISPDEETLVMHEEGSDRDDFTAWPSENTERRSSERRGSLSKVDTTATPTERLVGKPDEDKGSGIGMVHLLHIVLSHAVLQEPIAAPLVSALFSSFPIHAPPDQVEAFHLVLIEHCGLVVKDVLQRGEPFAIANCIGVCSVLLDRLMAGFFTSEPMLEVVKIVMFTLISLTSSGTYASRTLANVGQNLLVADAAHIARLACLTALRRSRPMEGYDEGDDDLKLGVLNRIGEFMRQLLLVPSNLLNEKGILRKQGGYPIPAPTSRLFSLWQSANLSRCSPSSVSCNYPDLTTFEEPDRAFVVTLMADIHSMLLEKRVEIREQAAVVVVCLLQRRREVMSELLIAEIPRGDYMETADLISNGGFGALIDVNETSKIPESDAHKDRSDSGSCPGIVYSAFFEWLERNQENLDAVFRGIRAQASRMGIILDVGAASPEEAIENEQKLMLRKLTSHDVSDRTILGGLGRAELAQRAHNATAENHSLWKRQGFDDLSSGAMQWKILLRQLKGSCTIWEGGVNFIEPTLFDKSILVSSLSNKGGNTNGYLSSNSDLRVENSNETVKRWKLDLTEGYEHQRRRLLPNYEFHGLYNIDEKIDNVQYVDETGLRVIEGVDEMPIGGQGSEQLHDAEDQEVLITPGELEVTADLLKRMKLEKLHDDDDDDDDMIEDVEKSGSMPNIEGQEVIPGESEVTADLLKKMKLEMRHDDNDDGDEMIDDDDHDAFFLSAQDESLMVTHTSSVEDQSAPTDEIDKNHRSKNDAVNNECEHNPVDNQVHVEEGEKGSIAASNYDLITGILKAGDWPEESYNVSRCTGLEVRKALFLWCRHAFYVVDGFEQTDGEGLKGTITRLEKATTRFQVNIRQRNPDDFDPHVEKAKGKEKSNQDSSEEEITYQHRSQRIAFADLYSVYRRRYQLQQNALEFFDVHRNGTLIAFATTEEREEVLSKVLSKPLPSSIFSSSALGGSTTINYNKFMNNLRAKITSLWVQGKITNFEFIMQINSFAGRTYNDLTQYPVFPWVLADYESEKIDLNDPSIYRDFSKPMGAQTQTRANQFKDRYESLKQSYAAGVGPPPFHYGTHYSCAAYVLHYLMRLEPFSRLALALQGGKFDVADRLFHNIGSSWNSASSDNIQDVRELIPEFFYLPDFLVNRYAVYGSYLLIHCSYYLSLM